jgi:thiamine biosynthesis lipoprotein
MRGTSDFSGRRLRACGPALLAAGTCLLLLGCASVGGKRTLVEREVLRVPIRVEVRDPDRQRAEAAIAGALEAAETLGKRLLADRKTSHFGILNFLPPETPIELSAKGAQAAEAAVRIGELSDGAYTPARRVLLDIWGISRNRPKVPSALQIAAAVKQSSWKNLDLKAEKRRAMRIGRTTVLDLEGVALGAMLDEALAVLHQRGVPAALISTGSIYTGYWPTDSTSPFTIDVEGTAADGSVSSVARVTMTRRAFAAVHPRQVSFAEDGTRIHEWIDPRVGRPVDGVEVAGVFAQRASIAAGLAVAAFIQADDAPQMMRKRPGAQWMLSTAEGGRRGSAGLEIDWVSEP